MPSHNSNNGQILPYKSISDITARYKMPPQKVSIVQCRNDAQAKQTLNQELDALSGSTFSKIFNSVTSILGTSTYVCGLPVPVYPIYYGIPYAYKAFKLNRQFSTKMVELKETANSYLNYKSERSDCQKSYCEEIIDRTEKINNDLNILLKNWIRNIQNEELNNKANRLQEEISGYIKIAKNIETAKAKYTNKYNIMQADGKITALNNKISNLQQELDNTVQSINEANNSQSDHDIKRITEITKKLFGYAGAKYQPLQSKIDQINDEIAKLQKYIETGYKTPVDKIRAYNTISEKMNSKIQDINNNMNDMNQAFQKYKGLVSRYQECENPAEQKQFFKEIRAQNDNFQSTAGLEVFYKIDHLLYAQKYHNKIQTQSKEFNELLGNIQCLKDEAPTAWYIGSVFSQNKNSVGQYNNITKLPIKFDRPDIIRHFIGLKNKATSIHINDPEAEHKIADCLTIYPHPVEKDGIFIFSSSIHQGQYRPVIEIMEKYPTIWASYLLAESEYHENNLATFFERSNIDYSIPGILLASFDSAPLLSDFVQCD